MGHEVVVVGDRRRPAHGELGQADGGRHLDVLDRDPRPDRIELLQPGEQVAARRPAAREPLVEVVVGVDQPGGDDAAVAVDHLVARSRRDRADLGDDAAFEGHLARPACPPQNLSCGHTLSYRARRQALSTDDSPLGDHAGQVDAAIGLREFARTRTMAARINR